MNTIEKVKQKRGRKSRICTFGVNNIENTLTNSLNIHNYILHIPLKLEEIQFNSLQNFDINKKILESLPNNVLPFNSPQNNQNNSGSQFKEKVKEQFQNDCNYTKNVYNTEAKDIIIYNTKLLKTEPETNKIIPQHTNIVCWWCCHSFDTLPVSAPIKFNSKTDIFEVTGVFCSFNCVKSYIFDTKGDIKNYLEVYLRKKLTNNYTNIKKAPSKYVLQMFGGPVCIEDYRKSFNTLTDYSYSVYPMIFIPSELKELRIKSSNNSIQKTINKIKTQTKPQRYIDENRLIIANKRVSASKSDLKIKRISNNLTKIMGIKIT